MEQITISVDELVRKANEMQNDGMEFVTLTLFESYGDGSPAWVALEAGCSNLPCRIDYEDIEAVEV